MTTAGRAAAYRAAGLWDGSTLSERIATHARERPDAIAVVDLGGARRHSYAELSTAADRVASYLASAGVVPGDVVAVQLPSWWEAVAVMVGVLRAGAVINPMLPIYRERELSHMLGTCGTKVIFTPSIYRRHDHGPLVDAVRARLAREVRHVAVADPTTDPDAFAGWLASVAPGAPRHALDPSRVSEVLFTSGTEAEPKAVMHTEETTNFCVRQIWSTLRMDERDVIWMPSPVGHSTGLNFGLRLALYHGVRLVLQDQWDPAVAVDLIERERCSYTSAAATFLHDVVRTARARDADVSSMRRFRSGGAPVPAELVRDARDLGITVLRTYGSTELLSVSLNRLDSPAEKLVETDGLPLPHLEVEIRGDDGRALPPGAAGEVSVRGPGTAVGFLADPVRTAATFDPDGFVHSGDLGVLDAEGYLTIVGRKKEIIIRGGLNVAPREVEELLVRVPGVVAAAVVGLPHARLGEIGCAFVVLAPGMTLTLEELVAALRGMGLAPFKLPERLVVVAELPMTSTGKVRKHALLASLEEGGRSD